MVRKRLVQVLKESLERCIHEGVLPGDIELDPVVEIPREKGHGDYATTVAFLLAKKAKKGPEEIARSLVKNMDAQSLCGDVTIAARGFINFHVRDDVFRSELAELSRSGLDAFFPDVGRQKKVIMEFVSANPTGPLHIGHGRGAAVGDVLANILKKAGYEVTREYYVNDAGRQIETLGRSVYLRWREVQGETVDYPAELYQGGYVREIAAMLLDQKIEVPREEGQAIAFMARFAAGLVLAGIKKDLEDFRVFFDSYYSEATLFERGIVDKTIEVLRGRGCLYEQEGALWFRTSVLGDEKDRVIVKSGGEKTYFASDIAYHREKFERGFDMLVDIWGADHHGYIERLKASIGALGRDKGSLKVLLIQFVTLLKEGKPVGMSTRAGQFTTLREVLDEVGPDAARFFFLMRKSDAHLEFDLDLAKKTSNENPVYYLQYAHARIESIFRAAQGEGIDLAAVAGADVGHLVLAEELELVKAILNFFDVLEGSAESLEPHRITFYLIDLVGKFHAYYNKARVLGNETGLTMARLALLSVLQKVIREGLHILGVSAPGRMERTQGPQAG
ncbi:MAG: arginine--tRNA ligase [Syntrophorhabdales bacterium]|jgi:arginyl-tRNA synthetase